MLLKNMSLKIAKSLSRSSRFKGCLKFHVPHFLQQIRGQQGTISVLLQTLQMTSIEDIRATVKENYLLLQQVYRGMRRLRHSYPGIKAPGSIFEEKVEIESINTTVSSTTFAFDNDVVDSKAYRRAFFQMPAALQSLEEQSEGTLKDSDFLYDRMSTLKSILKDRENENIQLREQIGKFGKINSSLVVQIQEKDKKYETTVANLEAAERSKKPLLAQVRSLINRIPDTSHKLWLFAGVDQNTAFNYCVTHDMIDSDMETIVINTDSDDSTCGELRRMVGEMITDHRDLTSTVGDHTALLLGGNSLLIGNLVSTAGRMVWPGPISMSLDDFKQRVELLDDDGIKMEASDMKLLEPCLGDARSLPTIVSEGKVDFLGNEPAQTRRASEDKSLRNLRWSS
ncbi:uncharacterized protein LY89DRAFT_737199 [Mollisia scopiformis]|uniref:Uncharacterized protein n=1 Tax=Mollisia scopiformis TaxID=149040 RepID=A0A194WZ39_MOLSC|nr:uncharacterized protein LY89DRAFT_737199 [Mollisia scopiformis]KUJ13221.1 hypothetical protein LY89DRAFT_737199 [Mollisia scopiformis]